jgi:excisionase family DNA binding protein
MRHDTPWANIAPTGPLLAPKDAAEYLGCGKTHFYALVAKGRLPKPLRLGAGHNGATVVPKPWLDAVIASRFVAGDR